MIIWALTCGARDDEARQVVGRRTEEGGERERPRGRLGTPTPIFVSPRVAVLLAVLGMAVLAYLLYAAPSILVVALGGMALALVLSFPVRALSQLMPRGPAILLTFLTLPGIVALAVGYWCRCSSSR